MIAFLFLYGNGKFFFKTKQVHVNPDNLSQDFVKILIVLETEQGFQALWVPLYNTRSKALFLSSYEVLKIHVFPESPDSLNSFNSLPKSNFIEEYKALKGTKKQ